MTPEQQREIGERLAKKLVGLNVEAAKAMCKRFGFGIRFRSIDGRPCLITADIRNDRIECSAVDGKITEGSIG